MLTLKLTVARTPELRETSMLTSDCLVTNGTMEGERDSVFV